MFVFGYYGEIKNKSEMKTPDKVSPITVSLALTSVRYDCIRFNVPTLL